ncbi:GTP--adenosylcobinamide-phosphate guanylyltransferase [Sphingomonas populi]|uniref:GTP--adenosylcobinamide-phosphate guanylyltransferase n=1 Tax=Sphingomonas populi TaxID=2484750 RepID=A0A4V2DDE1_9SPHN|nr:nucleotidyltransferase family protein [Sphingomonas populi]RZF64668.1 GTP--adenosylcobinamide-phosphate guanylyltransferase [Sphingomonas populi]
MSFNAVILAGSRGGIDPVAAYAGVANKALIAVGGRTMLARVVDALRGAGAGRILVSTNDEMVRREALALGAEPIAAEAGPSASAARGFELAGAPLLLTTADHALLRPEWITAFLGAVADDADVAVLLARRETIARDAPTTKRTYLRFADGDWSGCNLFWLATPAANAALDLWQQVERDRKRPWRIVRRLGIMPLLRYATGRLTLASALADIGARVGARARVVESSFGLAAVDVDKPGDLDLVRGLVE